jgi:hypothetical protein
MPLHRIDVELVRYSQRGATYRVLYAGKILLPSTYGPLFDACRAPLAYGISGRLELYRPGKATWDLAAPCVAARSRASLVRSAATPMCIWASSRLLA